MVVGATNLSPVNCFAVSHFCGLSSCPIYLFAILIMKKIGTILKRMAELINRGVVLIFLLMTYVVICVYRLFLKQESMRWHGIENKYYNDIEQTKHLW